MDTENKTKQVRKLTMSGQNSLQFDSWYFLKNCSFYQAEEVEALSSIYGEDWTTESEAARTYSIKVEEHKNVVILYVTMPEGYPSQCPPKYELSAPWMERKAKTKLHHTLDGVYL